MTFRATYFQAKPRWTNMNQPLQLIPAGHLAMDPIVNRILSCTWWIDQYHWWRYATDLSKSSHWKYPSSLVFSIYSHFVFAAHARASWFIILHYSSSNCWWTSPHWHAYPDLPRSSTNHTTQCGQFVTKVAVGAHWHLFDLVIHLFLLQ